MDFELNDEQKKLLRDTTKDLLARSYDAEKRNAIIDSDPGGARRSGSSWPRSACSA